MPAKVVMLVTLILSGSAISAGAIETTSVQTNTPTPAPPPLQTNSATGTAPSGNRYDVLSKTITPLAGVLLGGSQTGDRALTLRSTVGQVAGRLPQAFKGAVVKAQIEYPGRIRVEAPVMGETLTICRNGNSVWATPGWKVQFLLGQFKGKPRPHPSKAAPLNIPFTSQQAVFLPALFQLDPSSQVADIQGYPCRVISGGLIPEIAKSANAEDFSAKLWICPDYTPKRIDIHRRDFAMSFLIDELAYTPQFPSSTWQPPTEASDVYRCSAAELDQLLYVLMNSLQMNSQDKPWQSEAAPALPIAPQSAQPFGPMR